MSGALLMLSAIAAGAGEQSPDLRTYNPYPSGILPSDLNSETQRVQSEVHGIFRQALRQWRALPTPTVAGNPPVLQGSGYKAVATLGKLLNFDLNMSPFRNEACGFCHMPYAAFSGPIPSVNLTMIGYPGTAHFRAAKRAAQRYTYAPDFPVLEFDTVQSSFFGGNFWDARATGYKLQSAAGIPIRRPEPRWPCRYRDPRCAPCDRPTR